jgi:serine/threonine protein kinase
MSTHAIVKGLGSGANGSVFLIVEEGVYYVRKMFLKEISLVNEIYMYEKLDCVKGVLRMKRYSYEVCSKYYGYIDFEYIEEAKSVDEYYSCMMSEDEILNIALQVSRTLVEIHELGIVHRDIKTENILYDRENRNVYLIDWDCAMPSDQVIPKGEYFGTLLVNPVEFFSTGVYEDLTKIDVWQFGALLFDMLKATLDNVFSADEDLHPMEDEEFLENIRTFNWNDHEIENTKVLYLMDKIFKPEHLRISMHEVNEFLEDLARINHRKSY